MIDFKPAVAIVLSVALVACSDMKKQDVGVLAGGLVGGIVGNQIGSGGGRILATVGGAALGAYLGGKIGQSMDKTDRLAMNHALEKTPTNRSYNWSNPDSHVKYKVTPTRTYYREVAQGDSQPCRTFTTTALIDGEAEKIEGKACRQENGTWQMING